MKTKRTSPPIYEVEFVPLERRMTERRKSPNSCYFGPERRKAGSRRDDDSSPTRLAIIKH